MSPELRSSLLVSPLPWRHGGWPSPQPRVPGSGLHPGEGVALRVLHGLLGQVLLVRTTLSRMVRPGKA